MPHLISLLRSSDGLESAGRKAIRAAGDGTSSDPMEVRKQELASLLKKGGSGKGMEWGTCMIFSCANDCAFESSEDKKEAKEVWAEELVITQWEE